MGWVGWGEGEGGSGVGLGAFRAFVRFVLIWVCQFPLPLSVWEGLRFVIVALPGLFAYLFLFGKGSSFATRISQSCRFCS